ncbi:LAMI_0A08240g1_1 [Lachancea mirantina]|uniref:LAMI_0A08240g1_1 n=1 Tax=Lachancea mirantina TaxID=1230905 RepID=A0A1G4IRB5_9SACH|nr:LAMI_0A08240g1_1 [Lachancea mirantina]
MSQAAENYLRHAGVNNPRSELFPRARQRLHVPELSLPQTTDATEHLRAWIEECDAVLVAIAARKEATAQFDEWYADKYLRRQPPGILESGILAPAKRK